MLYQGRKFDLRVWMLLLDSGDVFIYGPGYVRTSGIPFTLDADDRL